MSNVRVKCEYGHEDTFPSNQLFLLKGQTADLLSWYCPSCEDAVYKELSSGQNIILASLPISPKIVDLTELITNEVTDYLVGL